MDMWQDKNDKIHELALLNAQAEITLDQTAIDASIREVERIHQHDSNIKGSTWVENTRALVRPIMAYSFMAPFVAVEVTAFVTLVNAGGRGQGRLFSKYGTIEKWLYGPVS